MSVQFQNIRDVNRSQGRRDSYAQSDLSSKKTLHRNNCTGPVAGISAAKKTEYIYIYTYYIYIYIIYIYILNLYFLEGWSLESAGKKNYFFFQLIFFGGLVAGKSAAKKTEKNICFIF